MAHRSIVKVLLGVGTGAVGWTITEYAMHRWVLHGPFGKGRLARIPLGGLHRAHHRDPLATSLPARAAGHAAIAAVAATAAAIAGAGTAATPAIFAGSAAFAWSAGYSTYEITHWNAHHRRPGSAWTRRIRRRHMRHHYGAPGRNLGVTMSWWDHVMGTEARR